jgi:hypothetical protein
MNANRRRAIFVPVYLVVWRAGSGSRGIQSDRCYRERLSTTTLPSFSTTLVFSTS